MEILKVNKGNLKETIKKAVKKLKQGNVLVCPTDTIYGLMADATNKKAVERIFKIKKRSASKPIPVFVKDIAMAKRLAQINKEQEKIIARLWPGKATLILKRKKGLKIFGTKKETIGIRIPNYKPMALLLSGLNGPLAETSVNISNKPALTKIEEITEHFNNKKIKPDLILDAGILKKSLASTVIDLTANKPKILRKGGK